MPRRYCSNLEISIHAKDQYFGRGGTDKSRIRPRRVQACLNNRLHLGARVFDEMYIDVPIGDGWLAVCCPQSGDVGGGWMVVTFIIDPAKKKISGEAE